MGGGTPGRLLWAGYLVFVCHRAHACAFCPVGHLRKSSSKNFLLYPYPFPRCPNSGRRAVKQAKTVQKACSPTTAGFHGRQHHRSKKPVPARNRLLMYFNKKLALRESFPGLTSRFRGKHIWCGSRFSRRGLRFWRGRNNRRARHQFPKQRVGRHQPAHGGPGLGHLPAHGAGAGQGPGHAARGAGIASQRRFIGRKSAPALVEPGRFF